MKRKKAATEAKKSRSGTPWTDEQRAHDGWLRPTIRLQKRVLKGLDELAIEIKSNRGATVAKLVLFFRDNPQLNRELAKYDEK